MSTQTEYDDLKRRITQMMWEIAPEWQMTELVIVRYDLENRMKVTFELEADPVSIGKKPFTPLLKG